MGCGNYNTARCAGGLPLPCYIQRVILQAHSLKQQQLQGNSEEETRRGMLPVKPSFASRCCLPLMWMRREAGREVLEVLEHVEVPTQWQWQRQRWWWPGDLSVCGAPDAHLGGRGRRGEKVWTGTLAPFIKSLARAIRNQTKEAGRGGEEETARRNDAVVRGGFDAGFPVRDGVCKSWFRSLSEC